MTEENEFMDEDFLEEERTIDDIVNAIDVEEKSSLANIAVNDSSIVRFSELSATTKPIVPLPLDPLGDVFYTQIFKQNCALCKSPFRTLAEHVYWDNAQIPYKVVKFFKKHFDAAISWECVDTHMRKHCDFSQMGSSGLKKLEMRAEQAIKWQYRLDELAINGILDEIDEIKGFNCGNSWSKKVQQANLLKALYKDLMALKTRRDEMSSTTFNVFEILGELYQIIQDPEAKKTIYEKAEQIRLAISDVAAK